jgi:hypothetical protein
MEYISGVLVYRYGRTPVVATNCEDFNEAFHKLPSKRRKNVIHYEASLPSIRKEAEAEAADYAHATLQTELQPF